MWGVVPGSVHDVIEGEVLAAPHHAAPSPSRCASLLPPPSSSLLPIPLFLHLVSPFSIPLCPHLTNWAPQMSSLSLPHCLSLFLTPPPSSQLLPTRCLPTFPPLSPSDQLGTSDVLPRSQGINQTVHSVANIPPPQLNLGSFIVDIPHILNPLTHRYVNSNLTLLDRWHLHLRLSLYSSSPLSTSSLPSHFSPLPSPPHRPLSSPPIASLLSVTS